MKRPLAPRSKGPMVLIHLSRLLPAVFRPHADREARVVFFLGGLLLELLEDDLDSLLELRVLAGDDVGGELLDVDIRRDADIFDAVAFFRGPERQVRCGDAAAVDEVREAEDADK